MSWEILKVPWEVKEGNVISSQRCLKPNPFPLTSAAGFVSPAAFPISSNGHHVQIQARTPRRKLFDHWLSFPFATSCMQSSADPSSLISLNLFIHLHFH